MGADKVEDEEMCPSCGRQLTEYESKGTGDRVLYCDNCGGWR